ncbi:hypothetical protein [Microseira sp. BLCC-F43]|jgi:hypothetical protein|uniref:hypothetical protein n=1 Tax=Microseira sp. BLCC-F43 TaxID=3153602 RepID=UPI0035B85AC0
MEEFFSIPAIWYPGQDGEEEFFYELDLHFQRVIATRQWFNKEITSGDYIDLLADQGINILTKAQDWIDGISYNL